MLKIQKFTKINIIFFIRSAFSKQSIILNKKLLNCQKRSQLINIYNTNKNKFDFINYNIFLNKVVKLKEQQQKKMIKKQHPNYIIDTVKFLCKNLKKLNNFTLFSFLSLCTSNNFQIPFDEFQKEIITRLYKLSLKQLNIIIKSMNSLQIKNNDLVELIVIQMMYHINNKQQKLDLKEVVLVFYNVNLYGLIESQRNKKLIAIILANINQITIKQINMVLKIFSLNQSQVDLNPFFKYLEKNLNFQNMRDASNLLNNFVALGKKSDIVVRRIIQFIKSKVPKINKEQQDQQQENEESNVLEIQVEKYMINELSPFDCGQILNSLIKLNVYDTEIVQILEANFINKINQSTHENLINYLVSHGDVCMKIIRMLVTSGKRDYHTKINRIKKYNHQFYNKIFTHMGASKKLDWIQFLDILKISAERPGFTNKKMFDLTLKTALIFLQDVRPSNPQEEEKFRQYINIIKRYQRKEGQFIQQFLKKANLQRFLQSVNDTKKSVILQQTQTNDKM